MKRILIIIFLIGFIMPLSVTAQETETLFSGDIDHGGFGSLVFGVTEANGQAAYLRGNRGAWVLNFRDGHTINLGIGWYRTRSEFDAVNWTQPELEAPEIRTNYSGFEFEYLINSNKLVHFGGQFLVGGGNVRYKERGALDFDRTFDRYFVLQPGVNVHLNITNWFRINSGVLYRHAGGVDLEGTSSSDLSGFSFIIGLRMGGF